MKRIVAAASCLAMLLLGPAAIAQADGKCDVFGNCIIGDMDNGGGGGGGGGGTGNGSSSPDVPGVGVAGGDPCLNFDTGKGPPEPGACAGTDPAVVVASPGELARLLIARVQLRPIRVGITPLAQGPDVMGLVGLPVWLWADDPTPTTWGPVTITAGAMSLTARVESVVWDMGDGKRVSCGKGTEWKRGMVRADGSAYPSPTCGHTYSQQGRYTITVTTHWNAHWSGYGQSGDIPVPLTTTYRYVVAELQAIRVR